MRPSTDLVVVVTDAAGNTKTLDSNAADPADRPRSIQFATQLGSGFYTGGLSLSRLVDRDNVDIHQLDDVRFIGANGDSAYEGYIGALPRSVDDTHTLQVSTAGWIGHTADEPFTEIFVDRDLGAWTGPAVARRVAMIAAHNPPSDFVVARDSTGEASLVTRIEGAWVSPIMPVSEALYDAGPSVRIGAIAYSWKRTALVGSTVPWLWQVIASDDDAISVGVLATSNLVAAGPGSGTFTPATPKRYATLHLYFNATPAGADGETYELHWYKVAVYGDHDVTLHATSTGEPLGVYASDVIEHLVARYCPLLNTAGVQATTYPIAHLVFKDRTTVYDALLKVNSYHLWGLAVWENRTLHYAPIDLTDWDWEIRHDDAGNKIGLQGDSVESLRNAIVVQFTNVATGAPEELTPDVYSQLRDDSIDNPANQHGRTITGDPYTIPFPTTAASALQLGRVRLLEDIQPKAPGSFTAAHHIKDRAGNWQPVWKVRAGDRIRLTSSAALSDTPRLIHETGYDHDNRTVTIGVDGTLRYLEAFIDRQQTALAAAGLT